MFNFTLSFLALSILSAAAAQTVTTESLLKGMTDLPALAEWPDPPFICKQFSSYDRASKTADDAKAWFANGDAGQFIRIDTVGDRKEHVMADMAGPGAIVRIWSANPKGTLRIYLDGETKPTIECDLGTWLSGLYPGVPKPIAGEYSKGWNSYFPIAYAKHCKITSDQPGFYYHVNYHEYPAGTTVQTFTPADVDKTIPLIYKVAGTLASPPTPKAVDTAKSISLTDAKTPYEIKLAGPKAIEGLALQVAAEDIGAALRGALLEIDFDGIACVRAPVGDFFSSLGRPSALGSLPQTVTSAGEFYSTWFMPFEKSASMRIVNHSGQPLKLAARVDSRDYKWTDRSMHFYAKWRTDWQKPTRPMVDWNYLTATGRGVFVGVAFNIANPVRDWWGEGDEKIYVDGETFPSWFGTGTEDYFGYAWCWPGLFTHAYHAQSRCDGPGNYGLTTVNRFHFLDRIPFSKTFRFDMELWHWNETAKVDMAVTSFWYARPGGTDGYAPVAAADLRMPALQPYKPPTVAGAIEGEAMKVLDKVGEVEVQGIAGCSGDAHLWWNKGHKVGDRLTVAFPVEKAGRYRVLLRCLSAGDYGVHQIAINDAPAGEPIDFFNAGIKLRDEIKLGEFDLKTGDNRLSATVVGANDKAVKAYMFGLDYIRLEPVEQQ